MDNNFFQDNNSTPQDTSVNIVEKIKVGGEEYSQEELSRLVGLGKIGLEAETKFNTKIDKVWPDYTRKSQELAQLQKEVEEYKSKVTQSKVNQGQELTPEELREQAVRQAKDLGLVTREEIREYVRQEQQATKLLDDINSVVEKTAEEGKPKTTTEALLNHMNETGIKNPEKAYRDMFWDELESLREKQVGSLKKQGMVTSEPSTAGSKLPPTVKVTKDNLQQLLRESLNNSGN